MKAELNNLVPSKKTNFSVSKYLHLKVKHYNEDLLNKNLLTTYTSYYSPPTVPVQKENGRLRLSYGYQYLNSRNHYNLHQISLIQDVIDIFKKDLVSVLDQQKAFHQIYQDEKSHSLTTFIFT